ncbi:hypothetical protein ACHHYP_00527 [Achlya hypogyna]|uniref:Histone RNA hairpin-binding protein RNA-binding domain-containing protein n=1 Tax=Achlya hypogyna TaxID=1202772 RepID=A0A1V9ZUF4_ACHHY|nr:hypothetical protein ACHHYP_00527 [Achlya hypogyna]
MKRGSRSGSRDRYDDPRRATSPRNRLSRSPPRKRPAYDDTRRSYDDRRRDVEIRRSSFGHRREGCNERRQDDEADHSNERLLHRKDSQGKTTTLFKPNRAGHDIAPRQMTNGPARDETAHILPDQASKAAPLEKNQMFQRETDPHKLAQRQKQIDYGKNTIGYDRYLQLVPVSERKRNIHPSTPDKTQMMSKRAWDGRLRVWRAALHAFDPKDNTTQGPSTETTLVVPAVRTVASAPKIDEVTEGPMDFKPALFDDFEDELKLARADIDEDDLL